MHHQKQLSMDTSREKANEYARQIPFQRWIPIDQNHIADIKKLYNTDALVKACVETATDRLMAGGIGLNMHVPLYVVNGVLLDKQRAIEALSRIPREDIYKELRKQFGDKALREFEREEKQLRMMREDSDNGVYSEAVQESSDDQKKAERVHHESILNAVGNRVEKGEKGRSMLDSTPVGGEDAGGSGHSVQHKRKGGDSDSDSESSEEDSEKPDPGSSRKGRKTGKDSSREMDEEEDSDSDRGSDSDDSKRDAAHNDTRAFLREEQAAILANVIEHNKKTDKERAHARKEEVLDDVPLEKQTRRKESTRQSGANSGGAYPQESSSSRKRDRKGAGGEDQASPRKRKASTGDTPTSEGNPAYERPDTAGLLDAEGEDEYKNTGAIHTMKGSIYERVGNPWIEFMNGCPLMKAVYSVPPSSYMQRIHVDHFLVKTLRNIHRELRLYGMAVVKFLRHRDGIKFADVIPMDQCIVRFVTHPCTNMRVYAATYKLPPEMSANTGNGGSSVGMHEDSNGNMAFAGNSPEVEQSISLIPNTFVYVHDPPSSVGEIQSQASNLINTSKMLREVEQSMVHASRGAANPMLIAEPVEQRSDLEQVESGETFMIGVDESADHQRRKEQEVVANLLEASVALQEQERHKQSQLRSYERLEKLNEEIRKKGKGSVNVTSFPPGVNPMIKYIPKNHAFKGIATGHKEPSHLTSIYERFRMEIFAVFQIPEGELLTSANKGYDMLVSQKLRRSLRPWAEELQNIASNLVSQMWPDKNNSDIKAELHIMLSYEELDLLYSTGRITHDTFRDKIHSILGINKNDIVSSEPIPEERRQKREEDQYAHDRTVAFRRFEHQLELERMDVQHRNEMERFREESKVAERQANLQAQQTESAGAEKEGGKKSSSQNGTSGAKSQDSKKEDSQKKTTSAKDRANGTASGGRKKSDSQKKLQEVSKPGTGSTLTSEGNIQKGEKRERKRLIQREIHSKEKNGTA